MIQDIAIDIEHEEYYTYLNELYKEISAYLMKSDGFMDSHKLDLFFDKISSPFVFGRRNTVKLLLRLNRSKKSIRMRGRAGCLPLRKSMA